VKRLFYRITKTPTDNIYSLGAEFIYTIIRSNKQNHWLDVNGMIGPGLSYPRTDATIVTPNGTIRQRNNNFKVAGGGMVFEVGLMGTIFNHLTFTLEGNFTVIRNSNMEPAIFGAAKPFRHLAGAPDWHLHSR
jgi:hypothetical protein